MDQVIPTWTKVSHFDLVANKRTTLLSCQQALGPPVSQGDENSDLNDFEVLLAAQYLCQESVEQVGISGVRDKGSSSSKTMADKLSSPSSSSYNSSGNQTPRSRAGNGDDPYLVIRRQPSAHIFPNESFEMEIGLDLPKSGSPGSLGNGEIELVATLRQASKTGRPAGPEASLICDPPTILLPTSGGASKRQRKVRCAINAGAIGRDSGVAYLIHIGPRLDIDNPKTIGGVSTHPINLVNYKIKISMEEEWDQVWYKDEGGRDKCMEVFAGIYDRDDRLRTGENVPLQLTLCYNTEDGESVRVTNQEILRTVGTSVMQIDKISGKARIRFRVEDVSKNHQGQDFKLEVGPDPKAKGFKDVAPGYTPAVSVRSKRNKRARNMSSSSRAASSSSDNRRSSPVGRIRSSYEDSNLHHESPFEGLDINRLREAMKGVIDWTDEVVNGLYPLQWQVLGYAQNPDGSPDYSRPYHNMPNPNPCINRVLSMYSDSARENLRILLNAVEQASPTRADEPSPYAPPVGMGAAVSREADDRYGMVGRGPPMPLHGQANIPHHPVARHPGMHPSVASDAFREKLPEAPLHYQSPPTAMVPKYQPMSFLRGRPSGPPLQGMQMEDGDSMQLHGPPSVPVARAQMHHRMDEKQPALPVQRSTIHGFASEDGSRESEVEYVLAKQYKALRTGERLGFPAYSANKEILGFYRESSTKVGVGQFTPISRHRSDFGPLEILQATEILEDAIAKKSGAVHALKDWGSISNLIDHALVYDWSKDIGNEPSASGSTE